MSAELDIANEIFIYWLMKKKDWASVPVDKLFSLWEEYGEEFKEVLEKALR